MTDKIHCSHVESVTSTNFCLKSVHSLPDGYVLLADEQTQGKGMGANVWESSKGQNITGSIVFCLRNIMPCHAFVISMAVSVAIVEFLKLKNIVASIKWPNDIYVDNKKLAGILIENEFAAQTIARSIIGIGLNVNQTAFRQAPNPVSLQMLTGIKYDVAELANELFCQVYAVLHNADNSVENVIEAYHEHLLGLHQTLSFKDDQGFFKGKIENVALDGKLTISDEHNKCRYYYFKEVVFLET